MNCPCCAGKSFCWDCKRAWVGDNTCGNKGCSSGTGPITEIVSILKNCNSGRVGSINVPKLRACPKCSMLIEHKAACKHMTCGRNGHAGPWVKQTGCKHQFCFICLKDWNGTVRRPVNLIPRRILLHSLQARGTYTIKRNRCVFLIFLKIEV